jgi:hypothetical protein
MTPPFNCPGCNRRIAAKNLTHCPACGASFADLKDAPPAEPSPAPPKKEAKPTGPRPPERVVARRKKRKKPQPGGPNWALIGPVAGGVAIVALVAIIALGIWLFSGGAGVGIGPGRYAVVDELPDLPAQAEPASVAEPEPKAKSVAWNVKADRGEPVDYSNAVGLVGPEQDFLRASLFGRCGIVIPPGGGGTPDQRKMLLLDEKTGKSESKSLVGVPFEVIDLVSGAKLGEFPVPLVTRWHRLSKDGTYLAGVDVKLASNRYEFSPDLVVYKRGVAEPVLRWQPADEMQWFDWVGPTRVAVWYGGPESAVVLLDVEKGGPVATRALPKAESPPNNPRPNPRPRNTRPPRPTGRPAPPPQAAPAPRRPHFTRPPMHNGAVSPNGKYAVLGEPNRLLVYETDSLTLAGQLNMANGPDMNLFHALSFDETGLELRALMQPGRYTGSVQSMLLRVWSMPSGDLLHRAPVTFGRFSAQNFLTGPEPGTIIISNRVIDLPSGALLDELKVAPFARADRDHLLCNASVMDIVNGKELKAKVPYHPYVAIGRVPFNREEYARKAAPARERARASGAHGTSPFDRSALVRIRTGPLAVWNVKPSPAPQVAADTTMKTWPAYVSAGEGANVVNGPVWLRVSQTGESAGEPIKLGPAAAQHVAAGQVQAALSLDGRRLAFASLHEPGRIDVWQSDGTHVVGLRPYGETRVEWMDWSSKGHLLTNARDRLTGWDVEAKKALFEVEGVKVRSLSGGKDWALVATPAEHLDIVDASTGTHLGRIPSDGPNRIVSLSPDGKTLLRAIHTAPPHGAPSVQVWDLTTGKKEPLTDFIPAGGLGHWVNARRMILSDRIALYLYDLDLHAVTYQYPISDLAPRSDALGRGWMSRDATKTWAPIRVPGGDGFKSEIAFNRGATVKVEIDVGHGEYSQRIARSTAEYLQRLGFRIGPSSWTLRADHTVGERTMTFDRRSGEKFNVSFPSLKIVWTLLDPDGAKAWSIDDGGSFDPRRTKYVKVGSRRFEGTPGRGGYQSWELDYDGKNPRKAQLEEIIETTVLSRGRPPSFPMLIARTEKGYEPLPFQAKVDGPKR